jgi:cellulose synthase operon protein C
MPTTPARRGGAPRWPRATPFIVFVVAILLLAHDRGALRAQTAAPASPAPAARDATTFSTQAADALSRGRLEEVDRLLEGADPADPSARAARARLAVLRGQYDEALALLGPLAEEAPGSEAALELGLLLVRLGRTDEGESTLMALAAQVGTSSTEALVRWGRAARALGQFRLANAVFRQASTLGDDVARINTAWGDLLLEKHNRADALRSYETALAADAEHAEAHLGMARALAEDNPPAAAASARRALALNPALGGARLVLAEIALDSRQLEAARQEIAPALDLNPNDLDARALVAALHYLQGDTAAFDGEVARILAVNPRFGELYRVVAAHVAAHYRFEEAVVLARKGVALDPDHARADAELGMHLLRKGDEDDARVVLDTAFQADPYDAVTYNLLALLDTLDSFETIETEALVVRLHPSEAAVMRDEVVALSERALHDLSERYGFTPRGPILIEMFPRHDDFAVRTLGLPGMVGALGACFGRVVTLDSPQARPPGSFNWQATLWHELAHVITLQMSDQRVPRWLTEGVSVFEERRAASGWGRESEGAFVRALADGGAIPLRELNAAFSDPRRIGLAYFQASLVAEHLLTVHGQEALHRMLRAYGEGSDDEAALRRATGEGRDALQASFERFLDERYGAMRDALVTPEGAVPMLRENDVVETLARAATEHPTSHSVQLALGRAALDAGDLERATEALERATALFPIATGPESARGLLARAAEQKGDLGRAMALLEESLARQSTGMEEARALAQLAERTGDVLRLDLAHERIVALNPFEGPSHALRGRLALGRRDADSAMRSLNLALITGAGDLVATRTDLAEGLLLAGKPADAKREVIAALEEAPRFERAQELLLRIVEGPAPSR